jgi:hypothetical protein
VLGPIVGRTLFETAAAAQPIAHLTSTRCDVCGLRKCRKCMPFKHGFSVPWGGDGVAKPVGVDDVDVCVEDDAPEDATVEASPAGTASAPKPLAADVLARRRKVRVCAGDTPLCCSLPPRRPVSMLALPRSRLPTLQSVWSRSFTCGALRRTRC